MQLLKHYVGEPESDATAGFGKVAEGWSLFEIVQWSEAYYPYFLEKQ